MKTTLLLLFISLGIFAVYIATGEDEPDCYDVMIENNPPWIDIVHDNHSEDLPDHWHDGEIGAGQHIHENVYRTYECPNGGTAAQWHVFYGEIHSPREEQDPQHALDRPPDVDTEDDIDLIHNTGDSPDIGNINPANPPPVTPRPASQEINPIPEVGLISQAQQTPPESSTGNTPETPRSVTTNTPADTKRTPTPNDGGETPLKEAAVAGTTPEVRSPNETSTVDMFPEEPSKSSHKSFSPGQITFSELMYTTRGGLFSHPQWIELYNNTAAESVNLKGWKLIVEARDSDTRHRYSVLKLNELHIAPNQTVLLVTRDYRNSGHLSEGQVYNLYRYHSSAPKLGLRENAVVPASGFLLKLLAPDRTLVDTAGNLDGRKRTNDTPAWELLSGRTEDGARTSLIRRYDEDSIALTGTEATSWVSAEDMALSESMYYGRKTDIGTPGYRSGGAAPVMLSDFSANKTDVGVIIEWMAASETNNAGFNILRGQTKEGSFVKVNPTLIQGAGTTAEQNNYTWTDTTAKSNVAYYYQIEDVSFSGNHRRIATVRMKGHISAAGKFTTTWGRLKKRN